MMTTEQKIADLGMWLANNVEENRLLALDSADSVWHDTTIENSIAVWRCTMLELGHPSQHLGYSGDQLFAARNKALEILEQRRKDDEYQPHQDDVKRAPVSTEGHSATFKKAFAVYLAKNVVDIERNLDVQSYHTAYNDWSDIMTEAGFPTAERTHAGMMTDEVTKMAIAIQKREALENDPVAMVKHLKGIIARAFDTIDNLTAGDLAQSADATVLILKEGLDK